MNSTESKMLHHLTVVMAAASLLKNLGKGVDYFAVLLLLCNSEAASEKIDPASATLFRTEANKHEQNGSSPFIRKDWRVPSARVYAASHYDVPTLQLETAEYALKYPDDLIASNLNLEENSAESEICIADLIGPLTWEEPIVPSRIASFDQPTVDLPSWLTPGTVLYQGLTEETLVAPAAEGRTQPTITRVESPAATGQPTFTKVKSRASESPEQSDGNGTLETQSSLKSTKTKIRKSAGPLWKEPHRESWIDSSIAAKKQMEAHTKAASADKNGRNEESHSTHQAETFRPAQTAANAKDLNAVPRTEVCPSGLVALEATENSSVVLWPVPLAADQLISPNDPPIAHVVEQKLTVKRAESVFDTYLSTANNATLARLKSSRKKPVSGQCSFNIPALPSTPAQLAGANSLAAGVAPQPEGWSDDHPYTIDWTQSAGTADPNSLPKLKSLSSLIPPIQQGLPLSNDRCEPILGRLAPAKSQAASNDAINKSASYADKTQKAVPVKSSLMPISLHNFASRGSAAKTLSLPAQESETPRKNSQPDPAHVLPSKPTSGAFAKSQIEDFATTTLSLEQDALVYEEPLYPATTKMEGLTRRGLPKSMVTTQQLKTVPAGSRRAEEYRKALKSNLALQRKCQILVERLVQERTAKLELLNHELQTARDKAVEAAKLKSQFVANVSHELRTPLSGILGMSELLREMNLNEEQLELADYIHQSAESLMAVVGDLLDFSKLETSGLKLETSALRVSEIINRVVERTGDAAKQKQLSMHTKVDSSIPETIYGDSAHVEKVLFNLVHNAVKFTEEGSITVEATIDQQTDHSLVVRFTVTDTGIGVSESDMDKLFNPFVQVDGTHTRKHGGTGLGLSVATGLVSIMSGGIEVASREGQGSTFSFTVPFQMQMSNVLLMPVEKQEAAARVS